MSLDKAIAHRKEKREPYRGSKAFDYECRNHGSCPWRRGNRLYGDRKRRLSAEEQIRGWKKRVYDDSLENEDVRE